MKDFSCPICLKKFAEKFSLRTHMKDKKHTIDGDRGSVRNMPETKMAQYHSEKTGEQVALYRYGK